MDFGWFHEEASGLAEINITPLVDVALVLLIIFMITAPMLVQGASVELPQTRPMSKLPSGQIFVAVTAEGEIFLNDDTTPVEPDALEERLVPFVNLGQAVYIQGDTAINYGRIMEVVDAVKGAGLNTVNLVTTPVPAGSR